MREVTIATEVMLPTKALLLVMCSNFAAGILHHNVNL